MTITVNVDLRHALGPLRDQGERPTCLAHATTAAHEHRRAPSGVTLSPEYLHYFASMGASSSAGISINSIRTALLHEGQTSESDCPYWTSGPPSGWSPATGPLVYKRHSTPISPTLTAIESAIAGGHAPVLGLVLPEAFMDPQAPWVLTAGATNVGRHAVLAVAIGQSKTGALVNIRNSWGSGWGDNGHVWLDERFLSAHLLEAIVLQDEA